MTSRSEFSRHFGEPAMISTGRLHELAKWARELTLRSNCRRRRISCIALDIHGNVLATGTNGTDDGAPYCSCGPNFRRPTTAECQTTHAEVKMLESLKEERKIGQLYAVLGTKAPCTKCTQMLLGTPCMVVYYLHESVDRTNVGLWRGADRVWINLGDNYG